MQEPGLIWRGPKITSWAKFIRVVKQPDKPLLSRLGEFSDAILIAGCQRSGTTAVTRIVARANGMADYRFGRDDELDAALILSGHVRWPIEGRYCFQTTYLNDRFDEYFEHEDFKLIWVLREPLSVVYSMLFNWRRSALDRLFEACGRHAIDQLNGGATTRLNPFGPSRLERACACYIAKVSQTSELMDRLRPERMIVLDYDELILHKEVLLERVFDFVGLSYSEKFADALHARSIRKGTRFSPERAAFVRQVCSPVYERARAHRSRP